jgi:competence protein ComEC
MNRLDGLLLTHGDSQHLGGAATLLEDFRPALVADSALKDRSSSRKAVQAALARRGMPKRIVQRGDEVPLGRGLKMTVLYPPAGLARATSDDKALVVRIECAGARALLMADSGFVTEQWLLRQEEDLHAEILVKGEHARDVSGSVDFLMRVQPLVLVASAPALGKNADDREAWAREVRARGIELFLQEEAGEVRVEIGSAGIHARGFVNGQTFRSRAR